MKKSHGDNSSIAERPWVKLCLTFSGTEAFDTANRTIIDTKKKLRLFLPHLLILGPSIIPTRPFVGLGAEGGAKYGRHGVMTVFQLKIFSTGHTYLLDVKKLGAKMWDVKSKEGISLRTFLESKVPQLWWDPRQHQDTLHGLYGITLGKNVICLQLMELAVRATGDRELVISLDECVVLHSHSIMSPQEYRDLGVMLQKANGLRWSNGWNGFELAEIPNILWESAAASVEHLELLYNLFLPKLTSRATALVAHETVSRLALSLLQNMPQDSNRAPKSFLALPYPSATPRLDLDRLFKTK